MSDFDDNFGDGDSFFTSGDETPKEDRPLGLVIGPVARVIFNAKREVIYDELAEMERAYRTNGRPAVVFEEEDDPQP